jgi:eukaryotic-like serine/threonine-protein kinase
MIRNRPSGSLVQAQCLRMAREMALTAGTRIGPYEITAPIGVGGMGEVYRATDRQLARDVAIKVLPEAFAHDTQRLARFEREAKTLASLNHSNVATIHDLENSGGIRAIVMELVDGPTLADRIARGPIPLDETLQVAKQVAEALEAAHEHGIVHRDLKPANIKLRSDGAVKVLDFGLSKVLDAASDPIDIAQSPTVTSPAVTQTGVILGTAAYMSPEQARGKQVDRRADVWAFGCVLYEMLAGVRAYKADSVADTIAAIVRGEPEWKGLPADVPPRLRVLLHRCLDKDPRRRLRDIGEARVALEDVIAGDAEVVATSTPHVVTSMRTLALGVGVVLLTCVPTAAVVWLALRPEPPLVTRLSIVPPGDAPLIGSSIAISPDGRRIVYVSGNGTQLSIRSVDELAPNHITNLGSPISPFISPDGQWIGFFDGLNAH